MSALPNFDEVIKMADDLTEQEDKLIPARKALREALDTCFAAPVSVRSMTPEQRRECISHSSHNFTKVKPGEWWACAPGQFRQRMR